jgi:uncharacterized SAM-binding protein YcdF (DUF218 family)
LFIEDQSLNTFENALFTRAKFSQLKETPDIVLVTGKIHMFRAMLTFEKQGFRVCALEAPDKSSVTRNFFSFAQAAHVVSVMHEYFGILAYRLSGRL